MSRQLGLFSHCEAPDDYAQSIADKEAGRPLFHVMHREIGVMLHSVGKAFANRNCAEHNRKEPGMWVVIPDTGEPVPTYGGPLGMQALKERGV